MYTDQIFILLGAAFAVIFLLLVVYLIASRKKSRMYKNILDKETEAFESLSATFGGTQSSISVHIGDESSSASEATALDATALEATMIDATMADATMLTPTMQSTQTSTPFTQVSGHLPLKPVTDFDATALNGQYELLGEIEGGGMSRVFLSRKTNVGNEWIVKYVSSTVGELTDEGDILKSLNHISLPKIIDIFNDQTGLYIVQSYIEGMGMNRVLRANDGIHEFVVLDWAQQLAQVLSYLHKNGPILHLDLKPSNIIVTHDNKLVLIDFGISRRQADASHSLGATVSYAAPEQLKIVRGKAKEIVAKRFGDSLPDERQNWNLDERTDIYSFGIIMFEAAVGHIPTTETMYRLKNHLSPAFCKIVYKCLEINPENRYQTVEALLIDIQRQHANAKPNMLKSLIARRTAKLASAASVALAVFGFTYGIHTMQLEVLATMDITPGVMMVSLQQSSEIQITRLLPNTDEPRPMDASLLRWEATADNIAQVDGNRIIGLNIGETTIHGHYRNAAISMQVNVVAPMDGMVNISLRYHPGNIVSLFAGTAYRDWTDGSLATTEFVTPSSMAVAENGAIYLADSIRLRRIHNGISETIALNPPFLRPHTVRTYDNDVYILTSPWEEEGEFFLGIIRITEHGGEGFFLGNAQFQSVRDFYISDGLIYFIERNYGTGRTHLRTINTQNADDIHTLAEIPEDMSAIAIGGGRIFMADPVQGIIMYYKNGELTHLAGAAYQNAFIDGTAPLFYRPTRISYNNGGLYVWDFNVLRRIDINNNAEAITIAGMASPAYDLDFFQSAAAEQIILPYSYLTDFIFYNDNILLTDPKRGVIWNVSLANPKKIP
ncbi:MAG: serine/threonine-protein kinase [Defluviitaleaceae bacterium]|nr:serine/threonine-protein kinase [Defluviitaleaceae bacterium]